MRLSNRAKGLHRSRALILAIIPGLLLAAPAMAQQAQGEAEEPSLYERLGGLQAISLAVSDFMNAFMADPLIFSNPAVKERKTAEVAPLIQYQVTTMVCEATGGPCTYRGPDMKAAHDGLNVSAEEWDRMVEIFVATLEKLDVPERESEELLAILGSTRDDIVVADMP